MRVQTRIMIRKDVRKRREGTLHKQELSQLQRNKGFCWQDKSLRLCTVYNFCVPWKNRMNLR